ncbi:putative membrane protein [Beauveria bassiana D1-5]|uniref:Putative membrane protein n=1 Tax=Beauveria bassiana D1-5 TaxID=1245745 RepID=A0A0A2VIX5_BEABA|nr:putative membrane protein [Beauveria bassiana D1-5]
MAPPAASATAQTPLLSASTPSSPSPTPPQTSSPTSSSATITTQSSSKQRQWNTKNLGSRLGADAVSASCAAGLISPLIAFIDKSIMETASGSSPSILTSLRRSLTSLVRSPLRTLASRPVGLVFLLYGGTYLTANTLDTFSSTLAPAPARTTTAGPAKFAASSLANVSLCVYKDQAFVKLFRGRGRRSGPSCPATMLCHFCAARLPDHFCVVQHTHKAGAPYRRLHHAEHARVGAHGRAVPRARGRTVRVDATAPVWSGLVQSPVGGGRWRAAGQSVVERPMAGDSARVAAVVRGAHWPHRPGVWRRRRRQLQSSAGLHDEVGVNDVLPVIVSFFPALLSFTPSHNNASPMKTVIQYCIIDLDDLD